MSIAATTARLFSDFIAAVGLLMMTLFGLCGAIQVTVGLSAMLSGDPGLAIIATGIGIGFLPAAIGFGMYWMGRRWAASFSEPPTEEDPK